MFNVYTNYYSLNEWQENNYDIAKVTDISIQGKTRYLRKERPKLVLYSITLIFIIILWVWSIYNYFKWTVRYIDRYPVEFVVQQKIILFVLFPIAMLLNGRFVILRIKRHFKLSKLEQLVSIYNQNKRVIVSYPDYTENRFVIKEFEIDDESQLELVKNENHFQSLIYKDTNSQMTPEVFSGNRNTIEQVHNAIMKVNQ